MKVLGGIFIWVASIIAQVIMYNMVSQYLPAYLSAYTVAIIFTWVGILITAVGD
jgi:hypothetical protein